MEFPRAPDPKWLDFLKVIFGFLVLVLLSFIAVIIALGDVRQESSHGLAEIIGGLIVLAGQFANWAFTTLARKDKND